MRKGFTLIELLVAVLIIGILGAVALPQYEKAVWKARFTGVLQVALNARRASGIYYMANGQYTPYWTDLDLDYTSACPNTVTSSDSLLYCGDFSLNLLGDDANRSVGEVYISYYPPGKDKNIPNNRTMYGCRLPFDPSQAVVCCSGNLNYHKHCRWAYEMMKDL